MVSFTGAYKLGYRTRAGGLFSHTTVRRLLQDATAKGEYKVEKNGSYFFLECPAIISKKLWDECQAILKIQEAPKNPGPRASYALAGFVYCSSGHKMYVYHRNKFPSFRCKECKTKILVEDIEAIYQEQLKSFLVPEPFRQHKYENLYEKWQQMSFGEKISIVEELTEKIVVFTDTIEIMLSKTPLSSL